MEQREVGSSCGGTGGDSEGFPVGCTTLRQGWVHDPDADDGIPGHFT